MAKAEPKVSEALLRAINRIAFLENKNKQIVYDELGYALGRQGGSAIQYWVYHKRIPARLEDLEALARAIARRNGWESRSELYNFLDRSGHPVAEVLSSQIFPDSEVSGPPVGDENIILPPPAPFIVGPPILNPYQFFGRSRELKRIFLALNSQVLQNVALIGLSRSGKTSLLHYIRRITRAQPATLRPNQPSNWLSQPQNYRWLQIDFQDPRVCTREGFMIQILRQLNFPVPGPVDLVQFVDIICRYLVHPTVILLDEIQIALGNPEFTQELWRSLRSLASNLTEGKLAFVIASRKPPDLLYTGLGEPSPFLETFGHQVTLGPLTREEAYELIHSSSRPFSQADTDWILVHSGRWPALLQILCNTRLASLEEGSGDDSWKENALAQIKPNRNLLETA